MWIKPKNEVIIVIPVYKEELDKDEQASLKQCNKILGQFNICFIHPDHLNLDNYKEIAENINSSIKFESFSSIYFENIQGYNNLLLNKNFYKRFNKYKFMLIYQLDAWIFRNELKSWCKKDYDYVGAPWFENWDLATQQSKFIGVGNGGFSLRKISTATKVLNKIKFINSYKKFKNKNNWISKFISRYEFILDSWLYNLLKINAKSSHFKTLFDFGTLNEDFIWGIVIGSTFKDFNLPNFKMAIQFSFETRPSFLYDKNNRQLPFGCHAWRRYEFKSFWYNYIKF